MAGKVQLTLIYHEIVRRMQLRQTPEQIAQAMGIPLGTLRQTLARPDFKKVAAQRVEQTYEGFDQVEKDKVRNLHDEIDNAAEKSMDRLKVLLDSSSESIRMKVSHDFLDRAGYGKKEPDAPQLIVQVNPIDAEAIATAMALEREGVKRLKGKDPHLLAQPASDVKRHPFVKEIDGKSEDASPGASEPGKSKS